MVSDYSSSRLELDRGEMYRDLSKPVGALNSERLNNLKVRREEMASAVETGGVGGYLYGSHYSCPGFVLYYLVRNWSVIQQISISRYFSRYNWMIDLSDAGETHS